MPKRVKSVKHLLQLEREKRSVISGAGRPFSHRPQPAAWMLNLAAGFIDSLIDHGLYVYEPKTKKKSMEQSNATNSKTESPIEAHG